MNATIIAVGSEMLTADKTDTNSLYITDQLNALGIEVAEKFVVGDDRLCLANLLAHALGHNEFVILTGGLGPTEDDITRDSVAMVLGRAQYLSPEVVQAMEDRFRRLGRRMAEVNLRQAMVIEGAEILPNDRGTAPGQWVQVDGRVIVMLPGPPKEMTAMYELQVFPRLQALMPPMVIRTRFYRVAGMGESDLDQLIAPVYTKYTNPATTILAALSDIQIHLRARCSTVEEAESLLAEVGSQIEPLLGDSAVLVLRRTLGGLRRRDAGAPRRNVGRGGKLHRRNAGRADHPGPWQLGVFHSVGSFRTRRQRSIRCSGWPKMRTSRVGRNRSHYGRTKPRKAGQQLGYLHHRRSGPRERDGCSRGYRFHRDRRSGRHASETLPVPRRPRPSPDDGHAECAGFAARTTDK